MSIPKISVIVPVYKVEQYLDRCVKSIVNQTYKNLEIILVDDGSPDRCPEMCDEWQRKDARIVVIHKENGGVASARNAALDMATGEYIAWVDSDDFVTDDFIETLYDLCAANECDIAQCGYVDVYDDGIVPCITQENDLEILSNIQMLDNLFNKHLFATIVLWTKLYKRHLFETIRFPLTHSSEDEGIIHKIIFNANRVAFSKKRMYMYYNSDDSLSRSRYSRKKLDAFDMLEERIRFFDEKGLGELSEKAIVHYCYYIILGYNKIVRDIPDCQDILIGLMDRYKRTYKRALFQKNTTLQCKLKFIIYRFLPRLPKWMGNKYVQ